MKTILITIFLFLGLYSCAQTSQELIATVWTACTKTKKMKDITLLNFYKSGMKNCIDNNCSYLKLDFDETTMSIIQSSGCPPDTLEENKVYASAAQESSVPWELNQNMLTITSQGFPNRFEITMTSDKLRLVRK